MILPVTDAKLQVTDASVLSMLAASKTDPAFVEFHDYDASRPYGKLYVDRKSDQRILVTSGLPMVRKTDGTRLTPGWEAGAGGVYHLRNNLFEGYVTPDGQYHIAVVNDQPTGPIANDEAHWTPVLTIGGEVVSPKSYTVLETDPVNGNYHDNVIEWDYGVCIRRIRVIEGRFRGSWIFAADPGADVRIDYHCDGKLLHKYGRAYDRDMRVVEVEMPVKSCEFIPAAAFKGAAYPVTVGDTGTYYPDANPETSTVDGHVAQITTAYDHGSAGWAAIVDAAGNYSADNGSVLQVEIGSNASAQWNDLYRSIYLFNTAALSGATISAAVLSLYGQAKGDATSIAPNIGIFASSPASNTALASGDYDSLGSTIYSGAVTYAGYNTSGYNDFTFNSTGLAAIEKTGVSKFGARNANYDAAISEPSYNANILSYFSLYASEQGTGYKPKLVVTYSPAGPTIPVLMNHYRRMRG